MKTCSSPLDQALSTAENGLRTLFAPPRSTRPNPAQTCPPTALSEKEKRLVGALMRVNHVGEVCAQALYNAQAFATQNPSLQQHFLDASAEETDHLAWTLERMREVGARPSMLNPLWYAGAFGIGLLAGKLGGDRMSLAFVVETEHQVEAHLLSHMNRLPAQDHASRALVGQMKADEVAHAQAAQRAGAQTLPTPVRFAMKLAAKVMTTVAHRI